MSHVEEPVFHDVGLMFHVVESVFHGEQQGMHGRLSVYARPGFGLCTAGFRSLHDRVSDYALKGYIVGDYSLYTSFEQREISFL